MSYEIPQQLAYKEKILFGLTFEQVGYALLFIPVALVVFFKTNWHVIVRWCLAFFLCCLAFLFMFFDFRSYLRNWIGFLKFRKADGFDERIVQFLEIRRIEDYSIVTRDGRIAILQVFPMNFGIKTDKEQKLIISQFRKFVNSLDFPIQILIDTVPLRLSDYLDGVGEGVLPEYREYFEEYKKHLADVVCDRRIMNRNFYLIIPESGDLGVQVKLCEKRLNDLGLNTHLLGAVELGGVVVKFFDGDRLTFCPDCIENRVSFLRLNKVLNRVIVASGFPRVVDPGFLDRIVTLEGDFDVSLHVEPFSIECMIVLLNKELMKQRADLFALQSKNMISPSLEIQYNDTRLVLEALQKGREKLFSLSFYVNCRAGCEKSLDLLQRRVMSELNSVMIVPGVPLFRMVDGFKSVAPLGKDLLGVSKFVTTHQN